MSMICTLIELFFHLLGFITSAKYFFKSKESYLVQMTANHEQEERVLNAANQSLNLEQKQFSIDHPANVDLFMLKYCFIFCLKVGIAYYRFRKNFLKPRDKTNPYDLETFKFTLDLESLKL